MSEMVKERLTSEKVERHDLFSSLLASNSHVFDASTLTEEELVGVLPFHDSQVLICLHYLREYFHVLGGWPRGSFQNQFPSYHINGVCHQDNCPYIMLRLRTACPVSGGTRNPISTYQICPSQRQAASGL
jgi:hypothetical protein